MAEQKTEGEGKNTWRTDRYSPCPRREAAAYLAFLASIGYQLSVIEQAVAHQVPYTGETPPGQRVIGQTDAPEPAAPDAGPNGAEPDSAANAEAGDTAAEDPPADDGGTGPDSGPDQLAA